MTKYTGWDQRLRILKTDVEREILGPLREHAWTVHGVDVFEDGEYVVVEAERGEQRHKIAVLYSSATANAVYKRLANEVEHIYLHGEKYKLESYAYGIDTPIDVLGDFHDLLVKWNASSAPGKFAPITASAIEVKPQDHLRLLAEVPIEAIWLRLRQLTSVTLAMKVVEGRARDAGAQLDPATVRRKAEGVSFALRNAIDYFHASAAQNVSQRVLNLYYGSMSFATAEMLAAPGGASTLSEIEDSTKQGHGLYTLDGEKDGLEQLIVGIIATGFFPTWMRHLGATTAGLPTKKARQASDLSKYSPTMWITIEQLFARIPEISDLFTDVFDGPAAWVSPHYDMAANKRVSISGSLRRPSRSYVQLVDRSARLTKEAIAEFPGPISEITETPSSDPGRHFRVAIDHEGMEFWHGAVRTHRSPFTSGALILPIFGTVADFRAICVVLLYALSIVVRYRPSVWRRVQEGDLDHVRALIEAFLAVVERVMPQEFLGQVTGRPVSVKQPGAL